VISTVLIGIRNPGFKIRDTDGLGHLGEIVIDRLPQVTICGRIAAFETAADL
jgi:hypothetical protein